MLTLELIQNSVKNNNNNKKKIILRVLTKKPNSFRTMDMCLSSNAIVNVLHVVCKVSVCMHVFTPC